VCVCTHRAQAALVLLQPRLTGEPAARASAHATPPPNLLFPGHLDANEDGGEGGGELGRGGWGQEGVRRVGGGEEGRGAGSGGKEKAVLMAQEKAVRLRAGVGLR